MKTITKVKNIEGCWMTCHCCGRDIMHGYRVDAGKEVFGSACVLKMAYGKSFVRKLINAANARHDTLAYYTKSGQIEKIAARCNMTVDQYATAYLAGMC